MNTKLNVVRFENEDVIATSGISLCDRDDHKKVTLDNCEYRYGRTYYFTNIEGLSENDKIKINDSVYDVIESNVHDHLHLSRVNIPNASSFNSDYYVLVGDHYEICNGIHAE